MQTHSTYAKVVKEKEMSTTFYHFLPLFFKILIICPKKAVEIEKIFCLNYFILLEKKNRLLI
jgi:hypothetical protein